MLFNSVRTIYIQILLIITLVHIPLSINKTSINKNEYNKTLSLILHNELMDSDCSNYIDKQVKKFMDKWKLHGVSVAISKDDKLLFAKGYGLANVEDSIPTTPQHLFRYASVSKLITATAIMKLKEEGKLYLNQTVFGEDGILYDEKYQHFKDKRYKQITVEHLLRHEAGFYRRVKEPIFTPLRVAEKMNVSAPPSTDVNIEYLLKRRLPYRPGSSVTYSNMGYIILSKIIEKLSGMSYENYIKTEILSKCGIYNMHLAYNFPNQKYSNEVNYYEHDGTDKIPACDGSGKLVNRCNGGNNIRGLLGAGAWIGSAVDLLKFTSAIDGIDYRPDILSKESIEYMTKNYSSRFPIGWMKIDYNNNWWRTGTLNGTSVLLEKQEDGLTWVFISNTSTWRGPKLPYRINNMMKKTLRKIKSWPENDLFNNFSFKPFTINIDYEEEKNNCCS